MILDGHPTLEKILQQELQLNIQYAQMFLTNKWKYNKNG